MKSKILTAVGMISTAFLFGTMPITVHAAPEEDKEVICTCGEKCSEDHVNEECEVCKYDYTYCQTEEPVRTVEYVDEDGNPIEKPEYGPLTPDGNLELVDDYGSLEAGGKQFITVVTKSGHYFYIIIDRDDKGNEKVHFLNKVDESDLLALMDEDEVKEYEEKIHNLEETSQTDEKNPEETQTEEKESLFKFPDMKKETKEPAGNTANKMLPIVAVVIVIAGVGVFFLLKKKKGTKLKKKTKDPDADYNEEDYFDNLPKDENTDDYDVDIDDTDENE